MTTTEAVIMLASSIGAAAAALAGALKLLARALTKSIDKLGPKLDANTTAIEANTAARVDAPRGKSRPALKPLMLLLAALALPMALAACTSTDPLTVRSLERNREVWTEDRRADLDPELIKSRDTEFDAQIRYEKSK